MEQAVWVAFGVIAIVVGFSVVVNLVNTQSEDKKDLLVEDGLIRLKEQCNFVCNSPPDTRLPVRMDLPSGLYLYAREHRICANYKEETKCEVCLCDVRMDTPLALNTTLAEKFSIHSYDCIFLRLENGTQMECKG